MQEDVVRSAYEHLTKRSEGYAIADLGRRCGMSEADTLAVAIELEKRGLAQVAEQRVSPVTWWDQDHLELSLDVPLLAEDVFRTYCQGIDDFCSTLRKMGIAALRPYTHETTLQIVLGAAAGFALAEFFKAFLGELGKKLAAFVDDTVRTRRKDGIDRIEVKGVRSSKEFSFSFTVQGSDSSDVTSSFDALAESLEDIDQKGVITNLAVGDEIHLTGRAWEGTVKRTAE